MALNLVQSNSRFFKNFKAPCGPFIYVTLCLVPATTRSMACSKCCFMMLVLRSRAAISAASLHTLAMSAPEKPGVWAAIFLDRSCLFISVFNDFKCTLNMDALEHRITGHYPQGQGRNRQQTNDVITVTVLKINGIIQ